MTRKARKMPITEPSEGSPADWFARGFEAGAIEGASTGVREVNVFRHDARSVAEAAASLAKEAKGLEYKLDYLIREMQRIYGETDRNPDRWTPHPMYLRGVQVFERQEAAASGRPTMQQQFAREAAEAAGGRPKQTRRRKARPKVALAPSLDPEEDGSASSAESAVLAPEPEAQPSLDWSEPPPSASGPATDEGQEEQMRRAFGQAWRA